MTFSHLGHFPELSIIKKILLILIIILIITTIIITLHRLNYKVKVQNVIKKAVTMALCN